MIYSMHMAGGGSAHHHMHMHMGGGGSAHHHMHMHMHMAGGDRPTISWADERRVGTVSWRELVAVRGGDRKALKKDAQSVQQAERRPRREVTGDRAPIAVRRGGRRRRGGRCVRRAKLRDKARSRRQLHQQLPCRGARRLRGGGGRGLDAPGVNLGTVNGGCVNRGSGGFHFGRRVKEV